MPPVPVQLKCGLLYFTFCPSTNSLVKKKSKEVLFPPKLFPKVNFTSCDCDWLNKWKHFLAGCDKAEIYFYMHGSIKETKYCKWIYFLYRLNLVSNNVTPSFVWPLVLYKMSAGDSKHIGVSVRGCTQIASLTWHCMELALQCTWPLINVC